MTPPRAAQSYEAASIACGADFPGVRRGLGQARLAAGDARGERLILQVIADDPDDRVARRLLIRWYRDHSHIAALKVQLEALDEAGALSSRERADLERFRQGLPLKRDESP